MAAGQAVHHRQSFPPPSTLFRLSSFEGIILDTHVQERSRHTCAGSEDLVLVLSSFGPPRATPDEFSHRTLGSLSPPCHLLSSHLFPARLVSIQPF